MRKSQSAMEFVSLVSIMLLIIVSFFAITSSKILESQEEGNRKVAEDIANLAYREIEIAKSTQDGYARVFTMPETVNGAIYTINVTDDRELIVEYLGYEYLKFLPANVTGNLSRGLNRVSKLNGIVYINSYQVIIPPALSVLLMKDPGNNAIRFDDKGNVILRGVLQQNQGVLTPSADDEFIFKNDIGQSVAIINLRNGNMLIYESLFEKQNALSPSGSNNFIIKDNNGNIVSFIDNNGNLYLKGTLKQNSNP